MTEKKKPLTAAEVHKIQPLPFKEDTAKMRDKKGNVIINPATGAPLNERPKRIWSFDGVHPVFYDDGTMEELPGRYVTKMKRQ